MFLILVIVIIIFIVLYKKGVFRKPAQCQSCGKMLDGTEQQVFKSGAFCLCKNCAGKIHPQIIEYAKENWKYSDYTDYLLWEEKTTEERSRFQPDVMYGFGLAIDMERGLFSTRIGGMVFRFADLTDYDLCFKPVEIKEGFLGDKVKGNEIVAVELSAPRVYLEDFLNCDVKLSLRKKGFLSDKYEYELTDEFVEAIRAFSTCVYVEMQKREGMYDQEGCNISEIEKALALFMFDSMNEVTADTLKQRRNALIKTFHPDNNEANEAYSQKINTAYELLKAMV